MMTEVQLDRLERIAQRLAQPDPDRRQESRRQLARLKLLLNGKGEKSDKCDQREECKRDE